MKPLNALLGFAEGLAEDIKPFIDLLKIEGYFTENMDLTPKGKQVLKDYWEKKYKVELSSKKPTAKDFE